ncbi:hypothetical protein ACJMK2_023752 [Sinanodonta woodiana]|uniref:Coiled-coil domain-containing protein 148 n=1 Tax=Sinanodonta woodiana TaxID=1069815 RepID=A0ABD3T599_SINWO
MSQPDPYKPFVTHYVSDEIDRLASRALNGVRSNKIKPVDYEKLKAIATEKKFSSHTSLLKVKKFEQLSKQNKENHLLKQHKLMWQKEFLKLNSLRKKIQNEVDVHIRQNAAEGSVCAQIYQDFEDYKAMLESDFEKFKEATTEPLWNLREDLQFWLQENMSELKLGSPDTVEKHKEIKQTVESVKTQQEQVFQRLQNEERCIEQELNIGEYSDIGMGSLEKRPHIDQGIPEEAFDLECPDEELKVSVLQEFINIDQMYLERLEMVEAAHQYALGKDRFGGWTEEEHIVFVSVFDQYAYDTRNRRLLIIDRLKRHLPGKTRADIVAHEDWWDSFRYFHKRCQAVMLDWQRDRTELMQKAQVVFAEACIANELEEVKNEYLKRHNELRKALFQKVEYWREQKYQEMLIKAEMDEKRREEMVEHMKSAEERDKRKRQEEKQKIDSYLEIKHQKQHEREEDARQRLMAIQKLLKEQAILDQERIQFRAQQLEKKLEERKEKEDEKDKEMYYRQMRLEALREKVRVIAENNPERVLQETYAWHGHKTETEDNSINIQKPLFDVHGYSSNQITADPRLKLETKLREAGLHNTDYARHVMKMVPPPQQPRRDMESNVFKQT